MTAGVIGGSCSLNRSVSQVLLRDTGGESLFFVIRSNLAGTDDHSGER